jgi:CheY-like chemotaxis protein
MPVAQPDPRAALLAEAAADVAHDFNNVLTVIMGSLSLAERHAAGNPKLIRLIETMRIATERGIILTQRLTALSISQPPAPVLHGVPSGDVPCPAAARRVLVVEDDPNVAEVAMAVLEDMGHEVLVRSDAASALALLQQGTIVDLVFSDIVMPGGMTGIELAEAISAQFPLLPILLATGYSSAALAQGALRFPVLAKPYSVQELSRRVAQMMRR